MNIKDMCIGDSKINEYRLENQTLTMIIQDHAEIAYEIVMTHCSYILEKGAVGFSLSEGSFTKNEIGDHWCFCDAEGAVLELKFAGYTMKQTNS